MFEKANGFSSGAADSKLEGAFEGLEYGSNVGTVEGPSEVNFDNLVEGNFNRGFGIEFDAGAIKA